MPWASTGWEYCKSHPRWHFLLKYRPLRDITHLPAWIAIHTNELISGGKLLLPEWVGEETSLTLQPEKDSGFLAIFCCIFSFYKQHYFMWLYIASSAQAMDLGSLSDASHTVYMKSHTLLCKGTAQSIHMPHHAHRRFSIIHRK